MENDDSYSKNLNDSLKRFLDSSAKIYEKNMLLTERLDTLTEKSSNVTDNPEANSNPNLDLLARIKRLEDAVFKL